MVFVFRILTSFFSEREDVTCFAYLLVGLTLTVDGEVGVGVEVKAVEGRTVTGKLEGRWLVLCGCHAWDEV